MVTSKTSLVVIAAVAGGALLLPQTAIAAAPAAVDDQLTASRGTPATINVLANDTDADNDALQVAYVASSDKGGTVDCEPTGECIFYSGPETVTPYTDSFDYEVTDGKGGVDIGTVTVQVGAPVASPSPTATTTARPTTTSSPGPSATPSSSASASPSPLPSPSPSIPTGTTHARSVTLSLKGALNASGRVVVKDGFDACAAAQKVKIQRRQSGRWRTVKTVTTSGVGRYSTRLRNRPGRYRAAVGRSELGTPPDTVCAPAKSSPRSA